MSLSASERKVQPVPLTLSDDMREQHLRRLMAQHKTQLMRMCYLYLGDQALAEDAVQETFLKAYAHMEHFRGDSSEITWLTRIAINTCKDMRKTAWLRIFRFSLPLDQMQERGRNDTYADDTVLQAVIRLPERDKQVILLRYYQQLKIAEIASILNVPESNVSSRLFRAKARLRDALKGWYFDEE